MKITIGKLRNLISEAISPISSRKNVAMFVYEFISRETDLDEDEVMLETIYNERLNSAINRLGIAITHAANDIKDESGFYRMAIKDDASDENGTLSQSKVTAV